MRLRRSFRYNNPVDNRNLLNLFSDLRDTDTENRGIMIGEGRFVVERMIPSGCRMLAALATEAAAKELCTLAGDRFPVLVQTEREISALAGYPFHRGILAAAEPPAPRSVAEFLTARPEARLLVLLSDPNIPENIGSICRSAAAFGADGLILPAKGPWPWSRRVLRSSMATILSLPVITLDSCIAGDIQALKAAGFRLCGTALSADAVSLTDYRPSDKTVLLLGNEAFGLSSEWTTACDNLLTLPMAHGTDSLNVAAAAAVFLYGLTTGRRGCS